MRHSTGPDLRDEATVDLCARIRNGDEAARAVLVERYFRSLHRWAHGRLPSWARSSMNTEDLVQETLVRALGKIDSFEPGGTGSFLAYMRQILKNRIHDERRKLHSRGRSEELDENMESGDASPMEQAIDAEHWALYEAALAELPEQQREGVIMRLELQFSHRQVADALGMSSANAARMMVTRAIEHMVEWMGQQDGSG